MRRDARRAVAGEKSSSEAELAESGSKRRIRSSAFNRNLVSVYRPADQAIGAIDSAGQSETIVAV